MNRCFGIIDHLAAAKARKNPSECHLCSVIPRQGNLIVRCVGADDKFRIGGLIMSLQFVVLSRHMGMFASYSEAILSATPCRKNNGNARKKTRLSFLVVAFAPWPFAGMTGGGACTIKPRSF